jgi:hypothetical protein
MPAITYLCPQLFVEKRDADVVGAIDQIGLLDSGLIACQDFLWRQDEETMKRRSLCI